MTNFYSNGYNYPNNFYGQQTQYQPQTQIQPHVFSIIFVSDIAEVMATKPDVSGKPLFFYNRSQEEFYVKQYDDMGTAPVKTYKLVVKQDETTKNPLMDSIKGLDAKLNDIKKLLTPDILDRGTKKNEKTA